MIDLKAVTLLNGRNHRYYWDAPDPWLSLKTMSNGHATYEIEGGRFAVDESGYLILNHQQRYVIEIDSPTVVESFCLFFPPGWVEDIAYASRTPADRLLDTPDQATRITFFERLYPHDEQVSPLVQQIYAQRRAGKLENAYLEEKLRRVLVAMLAQQQQLYQQMAQVPAARATTREELYRRLTRARDFMHASLSQPLSLEAIAGQVYLSPYHFLRSFKQVFGQTPHAYLTQKRLERAQFLLTRTEQPITEICFAVGFESLGSFSSLFQRQVGMSPRAYRKAAIFEK